MRVFPIRTGYFRQSRHNITPNVQQKNADSALGPLMIDFHPLYEFPVQIINVIIYAPRYF